MSKTKVFKWYKSFQEGREDEDDERTGRPGTSKPDKNVEEVEEMVMKDCRITMREGMKHGTAKFVPKLLKFAQKQRRIEVSQESLN
ncbi:protein GVQW3-like [Euwallacea similis]|uniref:protein GVQW3-like n=1 Tax=Euwallacea similis TaxID=1736056 RepID=UPI00344C17E6